MALKTEMVGPYNRSTQLEFENKAGAYGLVKSCLDECDAELELRITEEETYLHWIDRSKNGLLTSSWSPQCPGGSGQISFISRCPLLETICSLQTNHTAQPTPSPIFYMLHSSSGPGCSSFKSNTGSRLKVVRKTRQK